MSFPPSIFDGARLLLLTDGPRKQDGRVVASYTVRDAETGELLELVDIDQDELGGNEAPLRAALDLR